MALRVNHFLLLFFLVLILFYLTMVQGFKDDTTTKPIHTLQEARVLKDGVLRAISWRKLAMVDVDAVLDYDNAGANRRHDPRRRTGGGRP